MPVEINQKGQYDNTEIDCNRIKTVYGKENPNYFKRMIKEGFLFEIEYMFPLVGWNFFCDTDSLVIIGSFN